MAHKFCCCDWRHHASIFCRGCGFYIKNHTRGEDGRYFLLVCLRKIFVMPAFLIWVSFIRHKGVHWLRWVRILVKGLRRHWQTDSAACSFARHPIACTTWHDDVHMADRFRCPVPSNMKIDLYTVVTVSYGISSDMNEWSTRTPWTSN